jgi:hypothetical protein
MQAVDLAEQREAAELLGLECDERWLKANEALVAGDAQAQMVWLLVHGREVFECLDEVEWRALILAQLGRGVEALRVFAAGGASAELVAAEARLEGLREARNALPKKKRKAKDRGIRKAEAQVKNLEEREANLSGDRVKAAELLEWLEG